MITLDLFTAVYLQFELVKKSLIIHNDSVFTVQKISFNAMPSHIFLFFFITDLIGG